MRASYRIPVRKGPGTYVGKPAAEPISAFPGLVAGNVDTPVMLEDALPGSSHVVVPYQTYITELQNPQWIADVVKRFPHNTVLVVGPPPRADAPDAVLRKARHNALVANALWMTLPAGLSNGALLDAVGQRLQATASWVANRPR